jgi:hypothetical protein
MRNPRYKKLPGIDHGSANDSPAKYLENAADPESFAQGVTKETTPLNYMVPGQVAQTPVAGQNTAMMGTPLVPPPPTRKLGDDFVALQGKVDKFKQSGYDDPTASKMATEEVESGIPKKGHYKKK